MSNLFNKTSAFVACVIGIPKNRNQKKIYQFCRLESYSFSLHSHPFWEKRFCLRLELRGGSRSAKRVFLSDGVSCAYLSRRKAGRQAVENRKNGSPLRHFPCWVLSFAETGLRSFFSSVFKDVLHGFLGCHSRLLFWKIKVFEKMIVRQW